jgi:hypothetical protein
LKGGKELKKDRYLFICGLQAKLKVLHPLAEFKDQTVKDGQAFSELRAIEGVRGLVLSVPRLTRRSGSPLSLP